MKNIEEIERELMLKYGIDESKITEDQKKIIENCAKIALNTELMKQNK